MKNPIILTLLLNCFLGINLTAQTTNFSHSIDINEESDQAFGMHDMGSGILLLKGGTCQNGEVICSALIKTDYDGNIIWKKVYDYFDANGIQRLAVTKDRIYISGRFQDRYQELVHHILEINFSGDTLRSFQLNRDPSETFRALTPNKKGLLITSNRNDIIPNFIKIRQIDFNGQLLWQKWFKPSVRRPDARYMAETKDGDYLLSYMVHHPSAKLSFGLAKLDAKGNQLWEKIIDTVEVGEVRSGHFIQTQDNGIVLIFNESYRLPYPLNDYPPVIYKLDQHGNMIWKTEYNYQFQKYPVQIAETHNGDIIGTGYSTFISEQDGYEAGGWLFRLDKDGEKKWEKFILDTLISTVPYERIGSFTHITELRNGKIMLAGDIEKSMPDASSNLNIWLLKLSPDGCFQANCDSIQLNLEITTPVFEPDALEVKLFPNPTGQKIQLSWQAPSASNSSFSDWELFSASGKLIKKGKLSKSSKTYSLNVADLLPGNYFIRLLNAFGQYSQIGKFLKH